MWVWHLHRHVFAMMIPLEVFTLLFYAPQHGNKNANYATSNHNIPLKHFLLPVERMKPVQTHVQFSCK